MRKEGIKRREREGGKDGREEETVGEVQSGWKPLITSHGSTFIHHMVKCPV